MLVVSIVSVEVDRVLLPLTAGHSVTFSGTKQHSVDVGKTTLAESPYSKPPSAIQPEIPVPMT